MTSYEYILNECKKAHFQQWTKTAVEACVEKLKGLTRAKLFRLFISRWMDNKNELRQVIFEMLFKEDLERRETHIHDASIDELGEMLIDKNGKYIKLARMELKERYKPATKETQMLIIRNFLKGNSKSDVKCGEVREKVAETRFR